MGFSITHLIILALVVSSLVATVFYILCLQNALNLIDEPIRPISPKLAWLLLIPIFGFVWIFFLVNWVSQGYKRMGEAKRLTAETSAGFGVGIAYGVSLILCLVPNLDLLPLIPFGVFWILHWSQVSRASRLVIPIKN